MHEEYAEEAAYETMEAVRSGVMANINEQSISAKAKQYAARRARDMLSCMVEVHFLNRDQGEPDIGMDSTWQVDDEPPCSEPDSWARGCIQVATGNPTGKNRLHFDPIESEEAAAAVEADAVAGGGDGGGDGDEEAALDIPPTGEEEEEEEAEEARKNLTEVAPKGPLWLATEMWTAHIAMAVGVVSPEMIAEITATFGSKFAPAFNFRMNSEVAAPPQLHGERVAISYKTLDGCNIGDAMAEIQELREGMVYTDAKNTDIVQVSPCMAVVTQEFTGYFPDASGAPIPGTEAVMLVEQTCTYDADGLVTEWTQRFDLEENIILRSAANEHAAAAADAAAAGSDEGADLNATQWSRKGTTARAKSPTAMPVDDLEAVAWFYEDACVAVCDMTDPEVSELRMLKPAEVPPAVREVLEATMILFVSPIDWRTARKVMSRSFRKALVSFDKDQIFPETVEALMRYDWIYSRDFDPEEAFAQVSPAAGIICKWVRAVYTYARALQAAGPKMLVLQDAARKLARGRVQRQTVNLAATKTAARVVYLNGGADLITIDTRMAGSVGRKRVLPGISVGAAVNHIPRGKSAESLARGGGVTKSKKKKGPRGPTPPKGGKPGGNRTLRTRPTRTQKQAVPV